jgi:hypothetical protein
MYSGVVIFPYCVKSGEESANNPVQLIISGRQVRCHSMGAETTVQSTVRLLLRRRALIQTSDDLDTHVIIVTWQNKTKGKD